MMHVDRRTVSAPPILTEERGLGRQETKRVTATVRAVRDQGRDTAKVKLTFRAYKHWQVKEALHRLFHGKCAYCESRYAATQPMDVDHFRPKGKFMRADGTEQVPGYYWLAANWDNLFPSCIDCNRVRQQLEQPTRVRSRLGKGTQFPILDEEMRALEPGQEKAEHPLILDPCRDLPEEHLVFTEDAVVQPREIAPGIYSKRGSTSIVVYGLNRAELVLDRRQMFLLVEQRKRMICQLARLLDDEPQNPWSTVIEDVISHELAALAQMRRCDQPFSAMVRQVVDAFMRDLIAGPRVEPRR